jgi:hypothetical protein
MFRRIAEHANRQRRVYLTARAIMPLVMLPFLLGADTKDETPESKLWSLQPMRRPAPPAVADGSWRRSPVDRFIVRALETKGLRPASAADRRTLIRRASLDLIGLPPTVAEVDAFLFDPAPDAFDHLVDRLLASPRYGERWARYWLDLARYAESEGFKADETRPYVYRYRDYVIQSLNDDKPYDRFIREQIAGDELWPNDPNARVATGFNRHYPDESNARNLMQRRQEILNDITDTSASVFLGLTLACARCHDHKFDPITQKDYYRYQAFFANVRAADDLVLTPADVAKRHDEQLAAWEAKTHDIRVRMREIEAPARKAAIDENVLKYPEAIQIAIAKSPEERTPVERLMYHKAKHYLNPSLETVAGRIKGEARKEWDALKAKLDTFAALRPTALPLGTGIVDAGRETPKTHVLAVGVYNAPKDEVNPGYPAVLSSDPPVIRPPDGVASTGRRTALADWLTDPDNPLTARVMVNRIWQFHFGRGLVATASDFGTQGQPPSHPALLDWLADEFVRSGWSIKHVNRLIMRSAVYQQASSSRPEAAKVDPQNRLMWRFPRQRLEGEIIRDAALSVAGLLDTRMGGPSVYPELPPGMQVPYDGWHVTPNRAERNRRSIYVVVRRNTRYPMFELFDMPDTHEPCARRSVTTSAPQALMMLNSDLTLDWARNFAARVIDVAGGDRVEQIRQAYRMAFARSPEPDDLAMARAFFERHGALLTERVTAGETLVLPPGLPGHVDETTAAVLVDFCHMLINANEFVYRS